MRVRKLMTVNGVADCRVGKVYARVVGVGNEGGNGVVGGE